MSTRAAAALVVLVAALAAAPATAGDVRVTVVGDSVLTAVDWAQHPLGSAGVQADVAVCRRVSGSSCAYAGERVPTLLDLAAAARRDLGATVVAELGYDDPPDGFAAAVGRAVDALAAAGVQRILWLTLHEAYPFYAGMNDVLREAAAARPNLLRVVDWNAAAAGHADWFESDGVHLQPAGAAAIVDTIARAVADWGLPAQALPPPAGFREEPRLEPPVALVAGKPATVDCANADATLDRPRTPLIGGGETQLPAPLCRALLGGRPDAAALLTLVAEGLRQRGVRYDADVACQAVELLPRVAVREFGISPGRELRALMAAAWRASACVSRRSR